MAKQFLLSIVVLAVTTGCTAPRWVDPVGRIDHPANPKAAESPLPPPSTTLAPELSTTNPAPDSDASKPPSPVPDGHGGHDHMHHGGMQ